VVLGIVVGVGCEVSWVGVREYACKCVCLCVSGRGGRGVCMGECVCVCMGACEITSEISSVCVCVGS